MSCCGECERASRDPDPWRNALDADEHAYRLADEAHWARRLQPLWRLARLTKEAAEAFEVAADAWEEVGDDVKASIRRDLAKQNYVESFLASHRRLSHDWYLVSDAEARQLAEASGMKLPDLGWFVPVMLSRLGPRVELHRELLRSHEMADLKRKRPGVYLIGGVR